VDLLLALPRPKVMRRLWAQLAALGVGRIILTNAGRVERNYFDTHVLTADCYRPLLVEGLQQAKDTRLPQVSIHKQLKVLVEDELDHLFVGGRRIVADPASEVPLGTVARRHAGARLLLAIGPEGGWNAFELTLLHAHGFESAGMGPRTLRTDTACVALLSLVNEMEREGCEAARDAGASPREGCEAARGAGASPREGCEAARGAGVPASGATGAGRGAPATKNRSQ